MEKWDYLMDDVDYIASECDTFECLQIGLYNMHKNFNRTNYGLNNMDEISFSTYYINGNEVDIILTVIDDKLIIKTA